MKEDRPNEIEVTRNRIAELEVQNRKRIAKRIQDILDEEGYVMFPNMPTFGWVQNPGYFLLGAMPAGFALEPKPVEPNGRAQGK